MAYGIKKKRIFQAEPVMDKRKQGRSRTPSPHWIVSLYILVTLLI